MSACIKPLGHTGRCKGLDGSTWENSHPQTEREQRAELLAATAMAERDELAGTVARLEHTTAALGALATLVRLPFLDEPGPADWEAAETAARLLAPLAGVAL